MLAGPQKLVGRGGGGGRPRTTRVLGRSGGTRTLRHGGQSGGRSVLCYTMTYCARVSCPVLCCIILLYCALYCHVLTCAIMCLVLLSCVVRWDGLCCPVV